MDEAILDNFPSLTSWGLSLNTKLIFKVSNLAWKMERFSGILSRLHLKKRGHFDVELKVILKKMGEKGGQAFWSDFQGLYFGI